MNLVFGRDPLAHVTTTASSPWDGSGSFKLIQPNESWMKSNKGGINGQLQFSTICQTHNISTLHHDLDRLLPFKGNTAEILNQDLEASLFASNLDGALDLWRALSLLSNDSWVGPAANPGPSSTTIKCVNTKNACTSHPAANMVDLAAGFLQDEHPLSQPTETPFNLQNGNGQFQEFQLVKSPFQTSFFDSAQIH